MFSKKHIYLFKKYNATVFTPLGKTIVIIALLIIGFSLISVLLFFFGINTNSLLDSKYFQIIIAAVIGYLFSIYQNEKKNTKEELINKGNNIYKPLYDKIIELIDLNKVLLPKFGEMCLNKNLFGNFYNDITTYCQNWINENETYIDQLNKSRINLKDVFNKQVMNHCLSTNIIPCTFDTMEINQYYLGSNNIKTLKSANSTVISDEQEKQFYELLENDFVITNTIKTYIAEKEKYSKYLFEMKSFCSQCLFDIRMKTKKIYYI